MKDKVRDIPLKCDLCGAGFLCNSGPPGSCWCNNSPNMLKSWDLAGKCVCPDCLAGGKRLEILNQRKNYFKKRSELRLSKKVFKD